MHILVTNDDGVDAPGLLALTQAMRALGDVTVVAPHQNQSAVGHRKTLSEPIRAWEVHLDDGTPATAITGSPADCVALALLGLIERPIDMVASGINNGPNLSRDVTYSGTVTAAMEAVIEDVPAFAVSLDSRERGADYTRAAEAALLIAQRIAEHGLPPLTLLNVNVPIGPVKGVQITRQGRRKYVDELIKRLDPRGRPYYWIGGEFPTGDHSEEGADLWAVANGYISVTPITMEMTNYAALDTIKGWGW
ncbi:MAG: 5'/3'-nucleotidase SurE [Anaerolineae bacterium]|nr:5'/3'-nucleotidase SurE [Anaerolineae bacterium]